MSKTIGSQNKDNLPEFDFYSDARLQITNISWERVFLNLTVKSDYKDHLSFGLAQLILVDNEEDLKNNVPPALARKTIAVYCEHPIEYESSDEGTFFFRLNMTLVNDASFLENGRWFVIAHRSGDNNIVIPSISEEAVYTLPELDKIFPYGRNKYSYTVRFSSHSLDSVNLIPSMRSQFMIENTHWDNNYALQDRKTLKGKLRCFIKKLKLDNLQSMYNFFSKLHKHDGKNILFMTETKPYLWGNLKYLDNRIKERGLNKVFNISYSFRVAVGEHNNALSWYKTIQTLARQDFIFVDDYVPLLGSLKLCPEAKLIQVWHAGEGFKAVGYGRFGQPSSPRPTESCHKMYDYAITGSKRLVEVYSEVFGIPKERILPLGMARLDGFLDPEIMQEKVSEFYNKHPKCKDKKLILFSPTFRGEGQATAYYDYGKLDMDAIYEFCSDEYIWAFKMHPFVKEKPPIKKEHRDRIIDLGTYKNINDLYYVTDIMITDYSSAYFEYALLKRPVLFYTYDRVVYENTRGVHKSVKETAPGKICDSFDDLITALKNKDYEIEKTIKFHEENFGDYDGKAADRIIDTILLNPDKKS